MAPQQGPNRTRTEQVNVDAGEGVNEIQSTRHSLGRRGLSTGVRGLPCPPPGNLYNPGIKPRSPVLFQADSLPSDPPGKPLKFQTIGYIDE